MGIGIAIRAKSKAGVAAKNIGRASCQKEVFPWKSLVPTMKSVPDQTNAAKQPVMMFWRAPTIIP